jgi:hypothetical protein
MKFLRNTTWQKIYEEWQKSEAEIWQKHFTNRKHESWSQFRDPQIQELSLPDLTWKLYELDPSEIPALHCGPFPKWQELVKELGDDTFKTLSTAPHFKDHPKVIDLKKHFPPEIQLIATNSQIPQLIEGHHRCIALTQLLFKNTPPNTKITLALGSK